MSLAILFNLQTKHYASISNLVLSEDWNCKEKVKAVKLKYNFKGKLKEYKVELAEVNSNLGKGVTLYFVCPVLGIKCKTLFFCYGSDTFKSRQAYKNRIYYLTQISSKVYLTTEKFWKAEKKLNQMLSMRKTRQDDLSIKKHPSQTKTKCSDVFYLCADRNVLCVAFFK